MGNVQSEAPPDSESAKDGEEKASPEHSQSEHGPRGAKHDLGSRSPGPQAPERKAASQPLSGESGVGERPAEMGKNHSKKSKLKLSSMWAQNSASSGIKEASLCDKELGAEKWGLACLSRADLPSGQGSGLVLPEEPRSLKVALRSPTAAPALPDPKELSAKRVLSKRRGKPESAPLAKTAGAFPPQPGKLAEESQGADAPKVLVEAQVCWTQHIKTSTREGLDQEGTVPEPLPSAKKPAGGLAHGGDLLKISEEGQGAQGFRPLDEKNTFRMALSGCVAPPVGKKALLSWGVGQREKEEPAQDNAPGSDGDSRGPAGTAQLPTDGAKASGSPTEKLQAPGSDVKAGAKSEPSSDEAVNSETMQDLLEKGLNLLYKVTIQPGQWPPSIKAVKQKASVISSGISYADVLKQCPQKKSPAGAAVLPKALHHLGSAGKKLPAFKGLERNNAEEFSSLSQLFLEHFKKVSPKEAGPHGPNHQVVTFFEELSAGNPKRAEWQRPRPPTPYPQRRKGQGRKLPKFGTAVSQVVAFLGSDSKCDWFVRDENEALLDDDAGLAAAADSIDLPGVGDKGAEALGSSPAIATLLLEQETVSESDSSSQGSCRKPAGLEEKPKQSSSNKPAPPGTTWCMPAPPASTPPLPKEDQTLGPFLGTVHLSPQENLEAPCAATAAPVSASAGLIADQKAPSGAHARPRVRKQSHVAPKSKEKLKPSVQPKVKVPKGKGAKPWPRAYGMNSQLRLDGAPLFPPFEKVARPFYFGEPVELPLSLDKPTSLNQDAASSQPSAKQDQEADQFPTRHWPAFQVADACPRRCYCKHQSQRKLPRNVVAWLNPSHNHLAEPPWVATALLAVSLVAGTKFCMDAYEQRHIANED